MRESASAQPFDLKEGMIAVTLDPRNKRLVVCSHENEDILKQEHASLISSGDESKEVKIIVELPHGEQLTTFITLRRDGYSYQTTTSLTIHNVTTQPGMRGFRFCTPGEMIRVSQNRFREWRFADQSDYSCPVYRGDSLMGEPSECQVVDPRERRGHTLPAPPPKTIPVWKMSSTTLEDHADLRYQSQQFEELLHGCREWKPLAIEYSEQIEENSKPSESGSHSTQLIHGVINVTIQYFGTSHATQSVIGADGRFRIQVVRREFISEDEHALIEEGERDKEDCVICMLPILDGQACTYLTCGHNKNMHAFCIRHMIERNGTLKCSMCRTTCNVSSVFAGNGGFLTAGGGGGR
jgi:hypothetical protein